ncbi:MULTISPECIES: phosphopantetheine attachment domain protein [unclassified Streptomyces]|uniref:phosphopantetheine attachment domain protein n=1 Tax=unclassified Streptomyces TaxID=2593676 RepID=UPI001F5B4FF8|nr:phosphopantetheine attachment domain protein [Streptomyces sp. HSG2]
MPEPPLPETPPSGPSTPEGPGHPPLTPEAFRADLAECLFLEPDEVDLSQSPLDAGLDSLRIATLLERWRNGGARVTYLQLAECATFGDWWRLLCEEGGGAGRAES